MAIALSGAVMGAAKQLSEKFKLVAAGMLEANVDDVELLDYLTATGTGSKTITLDVSGSGTLPANSWTADVDLDVRLKVTAGWP